MARGEQDTETSLARIFGENVRYRRRWRRWTQQQLAVRALVSPRQITDIEHAKTNPTLATVEAIAKAFNLSPIILLDPTRCKTSKRD